MNKDFIPIFYFQNAIRISISIKTQEILVTGPLLREKHNIIAHLNIPLVDRKAVSYS